MLKRNILKMICTVIILMLIVAGCGTGSTTNTSSSTETSKSEPSPQSTSTAAPSSNSTLDNVNSAGIFPIVKKPITMKLATVVNPSVENIKTNTSTLMLQDVSGINLDIIELPSKDAMTKVNLMFASGDLPDIFTGLFYPKVALEGFIEAGKLAQLDEYIEEYGVGYKEFLGFLGNDAQIYKSIATFSDGHRYTLNIVNSALSGVFSGFGSIYEPWLEKLGEKVPTTLEEFYNLMVRFKNDDPNGNKKADEVPISGISTIASRLISYIGNAYQYTDFTYRLSVKDGVVNFIANNDLYKRTLMFMNKMCSEGLIDPLLFTQSNAELSATMALEDLTVGTLITPSISAFMNTTGERCRKFVPLPPLEGPDGYKTAYVRGLDVYHTYIITSNCKFPAAAYRLGDYLLSEEGNNLYRYGIKGKHWDKPDSGAVDSAGRPAYIKIIDDIWGLTKQNVIWKNNAVPYLLDTRYEMRQSKGNPYEYEAKKLAAALMMQPHAPAEYVPAALPYATTEDSVKVAELRTAIDEIVMEYSVQFIVGDLSFDMWGNYVDALKKLGVDEYVELVQKNYDIVFK